MQAARLLTLQAAWKMDQVGGVARPASRSRSIKFWGAKVLYNVIDRAIQVHGSLGYTTDLPLESMYRAARAARIYDGPDEVHKVTVARQIAEALQGGRRADRARADPSQGGAREVRRLARRDRRLYLSRPPLRFGRLRLAALDNRCFAHPGGALRRPRDRLALQAHRGVRDAVVEELVPDDLEPECRGTSRPGSSARRAPLGPSSPPGPCASARRPAPGYARSAP